MIDNTENKADFMGEVQVQVSPEIKTIQFIKKNIYLNGVIFNKTGEEK